LPSCRCTRYAPTVLTEDTPFKRLPASLELVERRYYEGIRLALEAIELAFQRLTFTLLHIAENFRTSPKLPNGIFAAVMSDAWLILDTVHRLNELIATTPRLKKKAPPVSLFTRAAEKVGDLRNSFHHAREDCRATPANEPALWGTVTWVVTRDSYLEGYTLIPNSVVDGLYPSADPRGRIVRKPIDLIVLKAFRLTAELSDLYRKTRRLAAYLEATLDESFKSLPDPRGGACDIIIVGDFHPGRSEKHQR